MTINAGVWIDHQKAVVILIDDGVETMLHFKSDPDATKRGTASKGAHTPHVYIAEDTLEHKTMNHLNMFYDEVLAALSKAAAILVVGPGEAKGEFRKRIEHKKFLGQIEPVQTTDKMTDGQVAAHVRQYFAPELKR